MEGSESSLYKIPKWTERYLWYKWLLLDKSMHKKEILTDRHFRKYIRRVQEMHIPLAMKAREWAHLPKPPPMYRRSPHPETLLDSGTIDGTVS